MMVGLRWQAGVNWSVIRVAYCSPNTNECWPGQEVKERKETMSFEEMDGKKDVVNDDDNNDDDDDDDVI